MNKLLFSLLILFFSFSPALAIQTAPTTATPDEPAVITPTAKTKPINYIGTYYHANQNIVLSGNYSSDVIIAGQNITVPSEVVIDGDLIAAGQFINISGTINGDVRVAGSTISFQQATIGQNVTVFANEIYTDINSSFGQDFTAYAATISLSGSINNDLRAGAGFINLNNSIGGKVYLDKTGQITLNPGAQIAGDFEYTANQTLINNGGVITGQTLYHNAQTDNPASDFLKNFFSGMHLFWGIIKLFGLLLIGILLIYLFPNKFAATESALFTQPGQSLLAGLIIILVTPLVCILLMFTLIGLPLGIIGLLIYILALYLSPLVIGLALGKKILPNSKNLFWPLLLGVTLFYIAKAVPFAGGLLGFIGALWVIGGYYLSNKTKNQNPQIIKPVKLVTK